MRRLVLLLVVSVPLVELFLAVQVGRWIGPVPTILVLVALSAAGALLVQRTGLSLWRRTRRQLAAGELPGASVLDGLLALLGAVLLAVPGFLTAAAGLVLLVPPVRTALRAPLASAIGRRVRRTRPGTFVYAEARPTYVGDVTPPGGAEVARPLLRQSAPDAEGDEAPGPPPIVPGVARALSPLVRRIVAPNAGVMTGPGTNTYLVGIDEIAVVDPGPDDGDHLDAIAGCGGDRIRWIVCTHTHPDHAPGAAGLKERTGAEVLAFSSRDGLKVDRRLADGDRVEATEFRLRAVHTPGHASNHLCYLLEEERILFSGDHIMQGSTVVIKPPDGDMAAYLRSLELVRGLRLRAIAPGHGHLIEDAAGVIDHYRSHRLEREAQVHAALAAAGRATVDELVAAVYVDVPVELHSVARYSVHAHLLKLAGEGRAEGRTLTGTWTAA